jgi:hypothetical protein
MHGHVTDAERALDNLTRREALLTSSLAEFLRILAAIEADPCSGIDTIEPITGQLATALRKARHLVGRP